LQFRPTQGAWAHPHQSQDALAGGHDRSILRLMLWPNVTYRARFNSRFHRDDSG
jgi:hypothetical protein